jgi:peptide/nickel transport system substrate-binding protein
MGELDLNAATSDVWRESLTAKAASRLARFVYYRLNTWRVDWNQNDATPYFKDQRVRHALLMSLDRERFAATAAGGLARPGVSYYTPESTWSDPSIKALPFDLKESARLLDEAGWVLPAGGHVREKNGVPFRFTLLLYSGSQEIADRFAAWMQQSWADVGIDAKVEKLGWETFKQRRRSHDFEAAMGSLSFDATPDAFPLFHSSACRDGFNYGCFSDPEIDRLLEAGRVTVEPTARRAIYVELQKRLDALQPMGFLFQIAQPMLFDRELEGIVPSPVGLFQFTPGPRAWHWSSAHKRT